MATTYVLISSNTLSSSAASVTFSSIPATYTDLVLKVSARGTYGNTYDNPTLIFNNDTSALYSGTGLRGTGSAAASLGSSGDTWNWVYIYINGSTTTANSFGNLEIYIPNYNSTTSKPTSSFAATETNATGTFMGTTANLYRGTSAITSITLNDANGTSSQFVSGSSFYLYGIKNS